MKRSVTTRGVVPRKRGAVFVVEPVKYAPSIATVSRGNYLGVEVCRKGLYAAGCPKIGAKPIKVRITVEVEP